MRFTPTPLAGAMLIDLDRREDERGYFARAFCEGEFATHGLPTHFPQHNLSFNRTCGTVRGLHFQKPPHGETKVVRCIRGAVFDVIVDLRPGSATHGRWFGVDLDAASGRALFIPDGFAHGFQTLEPETELLYLMGAPYEPGSAAGMRFDDPAVGIAWPLPVTVISGQDLALPTLSGLAGRGEGG